MLQCLQNLVLTILCTDRLMGSPMGSALANIFVGFHERGLLSSPNKLVVYFRYVNDTFCLFNNEIEAGLFFIFLNNIHPAFKFTLDKKTDYMLTFLEVLVCRTPLCYITSIYRKLTFRDLYTQWDSFCPTQPKINLIKTLTDRALMICSESTFDLEIKFISETLCNNGFLLNVVQTVITDKITEFN